MTILDVFLYTIAVVGGIFASIIIIPVVASLAILLVVFLVTLFDDWHSKKMSLDRLKRRGE